MQGVRTTPQSLHEYVILSVKYVRNNENFVVRNLKKNFFNNNNYIIIIIIINIIFIFTIFFH